MTLFSLNSLSRLSSLVAICLLVTAPLSGTAQTLDAIAKERKSIEAVLVQHDERTAYLVDRIARTEAESTSATVLLEKNEEKLTHAITKAEGEASDSSAREATRASIRYNRAEAKTERLQERLDSARQELSSIAAHRAELNQRLAQLAQEETRQREVQAKSQEAMAVKAAVQPKPVAPAIQVAPAAVVKPAEWPSPENENPLDVAFAKQLLGKLATQPAGDGPLNNVKLTHNRGRSSESLSYLGGNFYSVTMKLQAGMWGFKIYNDTFWVSIPSDKGDQEFQLVYDVNGKAALHLVRASLLR